MKFELKSLDDTTSIAKKIAEILKSGDVVFLEGDLGTGKTTFVNEIAKIYGTLAKSPTFSLVNLYDGEKRLFKTLFSLGDDQISTRQMDKLRRTEADNYNKKFNDFIFYLEDKMIEKKLFTKEKNSLKIFISFVIFSLLFFVGIISVYNEKFFGIVSIVFSLYFYASLISSFSKMTEAGNEKFRELEKKEKDLKSYKGKDEEDFLLAIGFGLQKEITSNIYENLDNKKYEIFFDPDFYSSFKTALVGDHLLVRN